MGGNNRTIYQDLTFRILLAYQWTHFFTRVPGGTALSRFIHLVVESGYLNFKLSTGSAIQLPLYVPGSTLKWC